MAVRGESAALAAALSGPDWRAKRLVKRLQRARRREEAEEKELVGDSGRPLGLEAPAALEVVTVEEELAVEAASSRAEATSRRQTRMRFCLAEDMTGAGGGGGGVSM
jgi:hypothetical protein